MQTIKDYPTKSFINDHYQYIDGALFLKKKPSVYTPLKVGAQVGTNKFGINKYSQLNIMNVTYQLYRIIFIMHNGEIPEGKLIDHIDGNPANNKIDNLQVVDYSQNSCKKKMQCNNVSDVTGVSFHKRIKKWQGVISINKKQYHLGYFEEKNDAIAARMDAQLSMFGNYQPVR